MTKHITKNKLLIVMLSCLGIAQAQFKDEVKLEPFPSNPIGMQTYIDKTIPNVAILFDNSRTMRYKMKSKHVANRNVRKANRPRRIDIVKDATLTIVEKYYSSLNFSYANLTDYGRDLHWKPKKGQLEWNKANAGYEFSPYFRPYLRLFNNMQTFVRLGLIGTKRSEMYHQAPYNLAGTRNRTPGTGRDAEAAFYKHIGDRNSRAHAGTSPIREEALQYPRANSSGVQKKMGKSLLVPHQNRYPQTGQAAYDRGSHLNALQRAIKTTSIRLAFLKYMYPNYVEYMADKIQYRCQNTYMLVITDGNNLTSSRNRKAARKYYSANNIPNYRKKIGLRPKPSNQKDLDGYYFNGPDFSEQNIRSFAIGIGTNPRKFRKFEQYGGGRAAVANNAEDMLDIMEEFIEEMHPSNTFSMTSPTGSFIYTDESSSMLVANVNTHTRGWLGELRFTKDFADNGDDLKNNINVAQDEDDDDDDHEQGHETAQYLPNYAVVTASTNKGLLDLTERSDRNKLNHNDLNLNATLQVDNYLKWIIGHTEAEFVELESEDGEEIEEVSFWVHHGDRQDIFKGLRSRAFDGLDERRYLGDVLSSSLEMIGEMNDKVKAPEYLTIGSNDGMFKIYKANPTYGDYLGEEKIPIYNDDLEDDEDGNGNEDDEMKITGYETIKVYDTHPYTYSFAYLPGTAQKANGFNVLQSLVFRAVSGYGSLPNSIHQYTVNGEVAFRTTNKGQSFLVGTLGQGGKGVFALNLSGNDPITKQPTGLSSPKDQWAKNVPLWDTSSEHFGHAAEGSEDLGYILGKPVIGRIALERHNGIPNLQQKVKYAAVVPAGLHGSDKTEEGPTVYIYDALGVDVALHANSKERTPGKLLQKITYRFDDDQKRKFKFHNNLSAITMLDLDQDGVMDIGYAGDLNGNLYRIDLRAKSSSQWTMDLIFEGNPLQPIVQSPSVSRFFQRPMVIFGTGSLMHTEFTETQYEQVLYGIMENKNFTAHKGAPIKSTDKGLLEQSITKQGNNATISDKRPSMNDFVGWKLPLGQNMKAGSEAIAQKPIIMNGTIFIQTFTYRDNQSVANNNEMKELMCFKSLDTSDTWLYQINAITGGALSSYSTYIKDFGLTSSGKKTQGLIDRPVKLLEANKSPSMTTDGELVSGNDRDFNLDPTLSSTEDYDINNDQYITGEGCKATLTNGMEIICPTSVVDPYKTKLRPGRLSIINRR